MGEAIIKEAEQVKEEIQQQVFILARWTPLGWNLNTIDYLYKWLLSLPMRLPEFMHQVAVHSRVLGIVGSLVIFIFLAAVFYSLFGRNPCHAADRIGHSAVSQPHPGAAVPLFHGRLAGGGGGGHPAAAARGLFGHRRHDHVQGRLVHASSATFSCCGHCQRLRSACCGSC